MSPHKYRLTAVATLLGAVTFVLFELFGFDSLVYLRLGLAKIELLGMDSFIGPVFLVAVALFIDTATSKRKLAHQAEVQEIAGRAEIAELAREVEKSEFARRSEIQQLSALSEVREQRLRVMRATMRTVQHIVFNFLNNLQIFRLGAEDLVEASTLKRFDSMIDGLAAELTSLGDLEGTPEIESCVGVMIDCEATRAVI